MAQVQVKLFTTAEEYAIPDNPFVLPGTATGTELNSLIKSVLKSYRPDDDFNVEFDFLLFGELLRLPLKEHMQENDVVTETAVEIEYFVKYPAPSPENTLTHDDWVSAVKLSENWILSGCYDDTLHIWSIDGEHKLTIPGHAAPIKAVAWIETGDYVSSFVSASHDETAMLWQWNQERNSVDCIHVCKGHTRGLECLDVNQAQHKFATGSYDQMLKIWSTDLCPEGEETASGDNDRKRFKTADGKTKVKIPLMTLSGHTDGITGVQWMSANEVCTCSLDNTIRVWDVELGGLKFQLNCSKGFVNLSYSPFTRMIISASVDRHVRLWDSRLSEGSLIKGAFSSHTGWVSVVKWSPIHEHQFISGAHDHLVKLWDVRSPKAPLFDMSGHKDKILALDWSPQGYIASGSADNFLKLYHVQGSEITSCDME